MKYNLVETCSGIQHDYRLQALVPSTVSDKKKLSGYIAALLACAAILTMDDVVAATEKEAKNNDQNPNNQIKSKTSIEAAPLQLAANPPETEPAPGATGAKKPPASAKNAESSNLTEVVVTGNRQNGVKQRESASPVAVISSTTLKATGQVNLIDALSKIDTSFYVPARSGDVGNLTRQIQLRQLGPNQTLVLVNGNAVIPQPLSMPPALMRVLQRWI